MLADLRRPLLRGIEYVVRRRTAEIVTAKETTLGVPSCPASSVFIEPVVQKS